MSILSLACDGVVNIYSSISEAAEGLKSSVQAVLIRGVINGKTGKAAALPIFRYFNPISISGGGAALCVEMGFYADIS